MTSLQFERNFPFIKVSHTRKRATPRENLSPERLLSQNKISHPHYTVSSIICLLHPGAQKLLSFVKPKMVYTPQPSGHLLEFYFFVNFCTYIYNCICCFFLLLICFLSISLGVEAASEPKRVGKTKSFSSPPVSSSPQHHVLYIVSFHQTHVKLIYI